jgi:hypothetical protein
MEKTHTEQKPKSSRSEITQRHRCGEHQAKDQDTAQRVNQVTDTARQRRSEQAHGCPGGEHQAELLRCQSTLVHKCRQKWRGHAKTRVHGGVEQNKSCQCLHRDYFAVTLRPKYIRELTEELGNAYSLLHGFSL